MSAPSKGPTVEHTFRILCHRIAKELTPQNCSSLKFLFNIQTGSTEQEQVGLDVMTELLSKDHLNHLKPETLGNALSEINRQDLVELVQKYKKSDEFKTSQKNRGAGRKWGRRQSDTPTNADKGCCHHMLSTVLMHTAQTVGQARYFMEVMMADTQLKSKKEAATALSDVKKDFDRLNKSLSRTISVVTELKSAEPLPTLYADPEELKPIPCDPKPRPLPPPKLDSRSEMTHSSSHPHLSSLGRSLALSTKSTGRTQGNFEDCKTVLPTTPRSLSNKLEPPLGIVPLPLAVPIPLPKQSSTCSDRSYNEIPFPASLPTHLRCNVGEAWKPMSQHTGTSMSQHTESVAEDEDWYDNPKLIKEGMYKSLDANTKDDQPLYSNI